MEIYNCADYTQMSDRAASLAGSLLRERAQPVLCAATGGSPTGLYGFLVQHLRGHRVTLIQLDEWGGIDQDDPNSCASYLRKHLVTPLGLASDEFIHFDSNPADPLVECVRMDDRLARIGAIDCCILGLGRNGHLGFNEPGDWLHATCHVAALTDETMQHQMSEAMEVKPRYGLTLGMKQILLSRKIILLITGSGKKAAFDVLMTGHVTTAVPASFLWLHENVSVFVDESSDV